MNLQRLKFAWARGARLQASYSKHAGAGYWFDSGPEYLDKHWLCFHIHPHDEHLQYGPLSTALRNSVLDPRLYVNYLYSVMYRAALLYVNPGVVILDEEDAVVLDMYKLFVAEYLADEGL